MWFSRLGVARRLRLWQTQGQVLEHELSRLTEMAMDSSLSSALGGGPLGGGCDTSVSMASLTTSVEAPGFLSGGTVRSSSSRVSVSDRMAWRSWPSSSVFARETTWRLCTARLTSKA